MTHEQNRTELAAIVRQLQAYGRYYQAMGLEEVGPLSSGRVSSARIDRSLKSGGDAPLPLSHLSVGARAEAKNRPPMPPHPTPIAHTLTVSATPASDPQQALQHLREEIGDCTRCRLHEGRHTVVFGTGSPRARLMFIGEAPGQDEDEQGLPFVGRAGQLLTKMIESMGFKRNEVYIANVIKCRPPENRQPKPDEIATCEPFLRRQIATINPEVICTLGSHATKSVLRREDKISQVRGRFFLVDGVKVLPTYHPAYLLRNPAEKRTVWEDLQKIMAVLKKAEA